MHGRTPFSTRLTCAALAASLILSPVLAQANNGGEGEAVKASKSRTPVTLNFVNADIEAVSRAMGVMIDRQILVDPRVKGTVTVYSETPLSVHNAYLNFLASIRGLGFTVVDVNGLLKVVPEGDAKVYTGGVSVGGVTAKGDQIITQIYRLNHENPNNLVSVLRPLISPNNTINANASNNTLIVTDYADNLVRLGKIIAALDVPASTDLEIVPIQHGVAADMASLVQRLVDASGGGVPGGQPGGGAGVSIVPDSRSNSLIIRAPNAARMAAVRLYIDRLDRPAPNGPTGGIYVVYLKNADAVKLAAVLRAAYAGGAGGGSSSSGSSSSSSFNSGTTTSSGNPPGMAPAQPTGGGNSSGLSAAATTPVTPSAGPSTGGFIQADPSSNSLIITAPEPLYKQIRAVIDQLDTRRAQIYVETMIVKVDAEKVAALGVQWQNLFGSNGDARVVGAGTNFGAGSDGNILSLGAAVAGGKTTAAAAVGSVQRGLNVGLFKKFSNFYSLGALANFLETEGGANILSTPNLVSLDNEEAKIVIGKNVPFLTGSFTTGSQGGTNPFQTVERKDVGLTLRIKSQVGEGGSVRMTVFQENSSVIDGADKTNGPQTDKSSIETTVVVDDGQTMVLGGLLSDEYTDGEQRVPGLSKIPLFGNLFKSSDRKRRKSNLMVFLRPVVLHTQSDADKLTGDRYEQIRALQKSSQPEQNILLPINESHILPPLPTPAPAAASTPATATKPKD